jgi:hypothetical protein
MRCVLCGKEYKRQVTDAHLKSHGVSREGYDAQASTFTEDVWEFYWTHEGLRGNFPEPLCTETKGKMTFSEWVALPQVQAKHPELRGE